MFRLPNMQEYVRDEIWRDPTTLDDSRSPFVQPIGMSFWRNPEAQKTFFKDAVVVMTDFGRCESSLPRRETLSGR